MTVLWVMGGALLLSIILIYKKLRTIDLNLRDLRKELDELHILKSRLFLKELNAHQTDDVPQSRRSPSSGEGPMRGAPVDDEPRELPPGLEAEAHEQSVTHAGPTIAALQATGKRMRSDSRQPLQFPK
jgi:hypothetical protein